MTSTDIERASAQFTAAAERLPTLYSLAVEWERLIGLLEDPESDPAEVDAELQRVAGDIRKKGHGVAVVIQTLENMAALQKAEGKRLVDKARANETHANRLRDYAKRCMQQLGIQRIEAGTHTLSLRLNPPSVVVLDAAAVPGEFQRTTVTVDVDKRAILDAFKATGEIPPGVDVVRNESLRLS